MYEICEIVGIFGTILSVMCAHRFSDTNYLILAGLLFVGITIIQSVKYFYRLLFKILEYINNNLDKMIDKLDIKKENEDDE